MGESGSETDVNHIPIVKARGAVAFQPAVNWVARRPLVRAL